MKATRLVDIATKSILKNKMRTLLTMLGIIIGVGAVIVMVAVGQGAKSEIQRRIDNLGTNMIVITQAATRQGGVNHGAGSAGRLTLDDYTALQREGLLLSHVSPVVVAPSQIIGGSQQLALARGRGVARLPGHPRLDGRRRAGSSTRATCRPAARWR